MKTTEVLTTALAVMLAAGPAAAGAPQRFTAARGEPHKSALCAGAEKAAKTAPKMDAGVKARQPGKSELGKDAVCPVTGEKFKVIKKTPSVSYKGHIYYFCCSDCVRLFGADPGKYAVKPEPDKKKAAAAAKAGKTALYVCPMGHYSSSKPGRCPKCGMTLVRKK